MSFSLRCLNYDVSLVMTSGVLFPVQLFLPHVEFGLYVLCLKVICHLEFTLLAEDYSPLKSFNVNTFVYCVLKLKSRTSNNTEYYVTFQHVQYV